jgi:pyrroline-5-carboxylate reductase
MAFRDVDRERSEALAQEVGGAVAESARELAEQSDLVVLAVKPAALEIAADQLGGTADALISVLGATPVARLRELFGDERLDEPDGRFELELALRARRQAAAG